jgi:hypothetical protein
VAQFYLEWNDVVLFEHKKFNIIFCVGAWKYITCGVFFFYMQMLIMMLQFLFEGCYM